jgi:hypothetical protein
VDFAEFAPAASGVTPAPGPANDTNAHLETVIHRNDLMSARRLTAIVVQFILVATIVFLQGCSRSGDAAAEVVPRNPKEAATQLQRVFESATVELKQNANVASQAMRDGDYEKAVVALQTMRNGKDITLEQGMAIHNSAVAMEVKLINAMDAGDQNAKRAYQLLKELKRK